MCSVLWIMVVLPFYCLSFVLRLMIMPLLARGRYRMVVGFTTTFAISAYHHLNCEFQSRSWRCLLDTTLCDKVCQ